MTQSELIKWYEQRLEKVIAFWSNAHNGSEYIEQAKKGFRRSQSWSQLVII